MAEQMKRHGKFTFFRSIRFRIMILLFVVGIVSALVVEIVVVQSYETRAINQRSVIVRNQCDLLVDQLVKRNFLENTGEIGRAHV